MDREGKGAFAWTGTDGQSVGHLIDDDDDGRERELKRQD